MTIKFVTTKYIDISGLSYSLPTFYNVDFSTVKEIVREALVEFEKSKEETTVAISQVTVSSFRSLMTKLELTTVISATRPVSEKMFHTFAWSSDEDRETPAACEHLKLNLLHLESILKMHNLN